MKIYNEVVIDMNTGETIYEDSFDYDGPMAMCGGKPGNDAEWHAAQDKIDANNALGPLLSSSFESMQKQFDSMMTVYNNQEETAENRYTMAEDVDTRAQAAYDREAGEGGFIAQDWQRAQDQYTQASDRKDEQMKQASGAVKQAITGQGEKSRRAAKQASAAARSVAAKSGFSGAGGQRADLSDLYRDKAMGDAATGQAFGKAKFAAEDALTTAGYTRDAADIAQQRAMFGASDKRAAAGDALTEAGYARDTAIQNVAMNQAQLVGKMEQDTNQMLTSFYGAVGTEYGGSIEQASGGKWFSGGSIHKTQYSDVGPGYDVVDTSFNVPTDDEGGG